MTALTDSVLEGLFYCSGHDEYFPMENFYKASVRAGETRCKVCSNKQRTKRRREDPMRWLQWKAYSSERRLGSTAPYPSLETIKSIVERCSNKSVLGDEEGQLCVVRIDLDISIAENPLNAVLVTSKQASHLPRLRQKRINAFTSVLRGSCAEAAQTPDGSRGDPTAKNQGRL